LVQLARRLPENLVNRGRRYHRARTGAFRGEAAAIAHQPRASEPSRAGPNRAEPRVPSMTGISRRRAGQLAVTRRGREELLDRQSIRPLPAVRFLLLLPLPLPVELNTLIRVNGWSPLSAGTFLKSLFPAARSTTRARPRQRRAPPPFFQRQRWARPRALWDQRAPHRPKEIVHLLGVPPGAATTRSCTAS